MAIVLRIFMFVIVMVAPARAAHFDIDAGRVVLRQLQYCTHCGSALLVTDIPAGALVRCPDCGHEQARIDNRYILNQLYQLCKTCQGPLNPEGHKVGDMTECENCHTRQVFDRDAFALAKSANGPGYAPGFPPGTAEKTLLLAPQRPDTFLSMLPLEEAPGDLPLPWDYVPKPRASAIPPPPEDFVPPEQPQAREDENAGDRTLVITEQVRKKPTLPLRESPPADKAQKAPEQTPSLRPREKNVPAIEPISPALAKKPALPTDSGSDAIDVPAVTADLFGGSRRKDSAFTRDDADIVPAGKIIARVNGEPIHQRDVDRVVVPIMERLRARANEEEKARIDEREAELRREALERLIDRELVVREAAAMGYIPDPTAIRERENELAQIMTTPGVNLRREAMRDITMLDIRRRFEKTGSATPTAVREYYQKVKDELILPRRIALDQLVVYEDRSDRADKRYYREIAVEIAEALERGATFDEVRDRYDEFTRAAGIEHTAPKLQPESVFARQILETAGDLRRGGVFGPLFLPGMALFGKVVDERKEGPVPFEEVEKEIRRKLEMEETEKNLNDWLKRLRSKARIEIAGYTEVR